MPLHTTEELAIMLDKKMGVFKKWFENSTGYSYIALSDLLRAY